MSEEPASTPNDSAVPAVPAEPGTTPARTEESMQSTIEADMAALKIAMQNAVAGGAPAGTAEEQLRALEDMHNRLQKLTEALRDYARGVQNS